MTRDRIIAAKLRALGLRIAAAGERGWCVRLLVGGEVVSVWATDAPEVGA
ncbi:MAG TPA: hypothetical protein VLS49_01180 [Usitatibacter sp.]|nr:hypothetical protein [Usitatibacter sp.]